MRRRTATGHAIAVWGDRHFLLREDGGRIIGVELINSSSIPECGERVKVVGYPETDLYRINLARASFRSEKGPSAVFPQPEAVAPREILLDSEGNQMIKPYYHGQLVRMRGEIVTLPEGSGGERILNLDCDGFLVPVDVSAHPDAVDGMDVGCDVEVTGICVLKSPNWCPTMLFPRIDGLILVPRSKDDLRVVSSPQWWTAERLLAIVGILLAVIVGILAWNWSLRRLAERRGRELLRAEMSKATAELRIDERTRLAAELHDSLAQNLTGVSLQIAAARSARAVSPEAEERHLCIAEQMLQSNRTELRRCIWDLRSDVLDEKDFAKAVRRTTQPVAGQSELEVDCAISRSRLSDSTAHAILRIVRELVSNAAVHGKAAHIRIKGAPQNGTLSLSVSDDGLGFDIKSCPGQPEGHFGLAGIRERCKGLGAKLVVESAPGRGTTVSMEMKLHEG